MSDRFNFYDVYGYLIPGFVLIAFFWIPIVAQSGQMPDLGFADAVGGLLLAYVVGHFLSSITALAFPSGRSVAPGDTRKPSDDLLDRTVGMSPTMYIDSVEAKVNKVFKIDLSTITGPKRVEMVRTVFLMCRDRLVLEGKGRYAEQFEGMYTMMRGLSGASLTGLFYFTGWILASSVVDLQTARSSTLDAVGWFAVIALVATGLDFWFVRSRPRTTAKAVHASPGVQPSVAPGNNPPASTAPNAVSWRTKAGKKMRGWWPTIAFSTWNVMSMTAGFFAALNDPTTSSRLTAFIVLAAGAVFMVGRSYASYEYFAVTFAKTVYRNFLALPEGTGGGGDD